MSRYIARQYNLIDGVMIENSEGEWVKYVAYLHLLKELETIDAINELKLSTYQDVIRKDFETDMRNKTNKINHYENKITHLGHEKDEFKNVVAKLEYENKLFKKEYKILKNQYDQIIDFCRGFKFITDTIDKHFKK